MKATIRTKFLLPTISLIIIGLGASTAISYVKSKNALSRALLGDIEQQANTSAAALGDWLRDLQLDLASWTTEEVYRKATTSSIIGKAARATVNDKVAALVENYGIYEDIFLADENGLIIAGKRQESIGQIKVGDRDYFKSAMAGKLFVSDVLISRASGKPISVIAAPVVDRGTIKGVLTSVVSMEAISTRIIDTIKVGENGYAYAVKKDGTFIAHPDRSKIMKESLGGQEYFKKMVSQKNGIVSYSYEGQKNQVAFQSVEEKGWLVAVTVPESEILAPVRSLGLLNLMVAVGVIIVAVIIIFVITSSVVNPINRVVAGLQDAAQGDGDLTKRIELNSNDEVGELARWFNTFIEKIQGIVSEVTRNAQDLSNSSRELAGIAGELTESAGQTSGKAMNVSAASKEMSSTVSTAADIMEETTGNLSIIASGAEEMTATIDEIAANAEKGRQIAEDAVGQTSRANGQIRELGDAAEQIGKVVETITEISEQVNLLALNATIEAARAGEAGKGFAVVANEIKELAKQTAAASDEIKQRISGIQNSTHATVTEITGIAGVVSQVSELVATIATAVEEQSITTRDIAGNVAKASEGVGEVNTTIAESSKAAGEIVREIADVTQAASEMSGASSRVDASSNELARLAEELNFMVKQFKV